MKTTKLSPSSDSNIGVTNNERLTSMVDITEKNNSKDALKESADRFRLIFEKTADALLLLDPITNKFVDGNYAALNMMGYKSVKELLPLHPAELSPLHQPDGRDSFGKAQEMIAIAIEKGSHRFKWIHCSPHREAFPVEVLLTPVQIGKQQLIITTWRDITAQEQSEAKLKESESRLKEAIWGTEAGIYDWHILTGQLIVNERWAEIVGYSLQELEPISIVTWDKLIYPDDGKRADELINRCINQESDSYECEVRLRHKHGHWVWILDRGRISEWSENGKAIRMSGTHQDITERKLTELRHKSSTEVLELIASDALLPVILETIVRSVEYDDPSMLCSIQLLDDDGKHLLSGAAPSLPDFYNVAIHGVEIGVGVGSCGTAAYTNERVIVNDIQNHPYWASYKELASKAGLGACWSEPIRSTQGKVLGTFAIYHHDVNQPSVAHIALIEQVASLASIAIEKIQVNLALKASNEQTQLVLAGAQLGFWDWNIITGEVERNERWATMIGYTHDEIKHTTNQWADFVHPEDRERAWQSIYDALEGRSKIHSLDYRMLNKEGGYIWIHDQASVVQRDSNGKPLRMSGTHSDVTERKLAEEKLKLAASVFSNACEGIVITDASGSIIEVNDTFTDITGYSREDIIGQNPRILQSGRQSPAFYAEMWKSLLENKQWKGEVWNRRKSGEVYAELLTISAVQDAAGQVQNYVALFNLNPV